MVWLLLVTSLSGNHGALRLRFWRALKTLGAAALRDGVYIAPDIEAVAQAFAEQATEIAASGGSAFVLKVPSLPRAGDPIDPKMRARCPCLVLEVYSIAQLYACVRRGRLFGREPLCQRGFGLMKRSSGRVSRCPWEEIRCFD